MWWLKFSVPVLITSSFSGTKYVSCPMVLHLVNILVVVQHDFTCSNVLKLSNAAAVFQIHCTDSKLWTSAQILSSAVNVPGKVPSP
jgi:hypothetical protein